MLDSGLHAADSGVFVSETSILDSSRYWDRGEGGRYSRNFWVGVCRWDPGTLSLYQSYSSSAEFCYPILD